MKTKKKDVDLGKDNVRHLLFVLAIPAITSQVVNVLYNMVDRMYIGHIDKVGSIALTGVGVCFPIIMIISAFAFLVGIGGSPRASIYMGKKDNKMAEKILGNCFSAIIITSIILTIILVSFHEPILYMFGASENTISYASDYIMIYALGTIFVQLTLGMNAFISAQGFSKISMLTVLIGAVTNIILDPIFIFGLNMGVKGAACATIISQAISAFWALRFLFGKKTILRLRKENFKISFSVLLPCIALGIAPFTMQSTESLLVLCMNSSLLKYGGDLAVGAMAILSSVMQFTLLPLQGITQGGQPIISYNYGAANRKRVNQAVKLQLSYCFIYALTMCLLVECFPDIFIAIFTNDKQLVELTRWAMRIYMAAVALMGVQTACQQVFISFGNSKISVFIAVFRKIIVLIPLIYILPMFLEDKLFAVFFAEPVADVIAVSTTLVIFYFNYKRVNKELIERENLKNIV